MGGPELMHLTYLCPEGVARGGWGRSTLVRDFPLLSEKSYRFEAQGSEGIAVERGNG